MPHRNAKLTAAGRLLIVHRREQGWTQAQAAEAQGVSRSTVAKWWKRYREQGVEGFRRRALPQSDGRALGEDVVEAVLSLRRMGFKEAAARGLPESRSRRKHPFRTWPPTGLLP